MTLTEKILKHVKDLPEPFQAEVLDFIEYLESKAAQSKGDISETEWSELSLSFAMRGIEDESSPYSLDDLKERFG
jgi:hypothetical protein